MEWLDWIKSNLVKWAKSFHTWMCGVLGCGCCLNTTECLDKVAQKTKIKLRKKAKKKGK